jgi:hypothetical protein
MERTISLWGRGNVIDVSPLLQRRWKRAKIIQNGEHFTVRRAGLPIVYAVLAMLAVSSANALAESCVIASDMDPATRTALNAAALHSFDLIAKGDVAGLRQSAIPSLAEDFSGVEGRVKDNQSALAGSKATARPSFLLEADGTAAIPHAEFYCGVFGSKGQTHDSAAFTLNNLPPGKYGVVILDAPSSKGAYTVSLILQQQGAEWKLGNLYIKAEQPSGHDSDWFIAHAREFQAKGQVHNAWLYYVEARSLISPLPFMSTAATDKLYDDSQKLQPADFPADGKTVDLSSGTSAAVSASPGISTCKLTAIFPDVVGNDLDLVVRYQAADVSNTQLAYQNNVAVMKALLVKYPELRDAFAAVVARAVDPNGRDYGTLLAMKDIK